MTAKKQNELLQKMLETNKKLTVGEAGRALNNLKRMIYGEVKEYAPQRALNIVPYEFKEWA